MLIARAPVRVSYAGGGTDLDFYAADHEGLVVNAAINKYFYVFISPNGHGSLQISSADFRAFLRYDSDELPLAVGGPIKHVHAACGYVGIRRGYSIFIASEVPSGTGLGSSSAVAVALVKGLSALKNESPSPSDLARAACEIELDILKMPIGRQDQYASAFGGINAITFSATGVEVEPLDLTTDCLRRLEESTMLFYTGLSHDSSQILEEQRTRIRGGKRATLKALHTIKDSAVAAREALLEARPDCLGALMDTAWQAKKQLSGSISNQFIDDAYTAARRAGALGGKIAGAGGGGFLLLYCPMESQDSVTRALHSLGLLRTDFHFDFAGARILMNNVAG
jgi:D-glycero-alpha-D-manno-heptose-7-phosphate kinase